MGMVISVSGAVGGIGTSTFAYALALQADPVLQSGCRAVLVDAQSDGAPLDLLVGAEAAPGIRWSQVRIRTTDIAADTILAALPQHRGVAVLSSDRDAAVDAAALGHVVSVLREENCVLVLDLPARDPLRESLRPDIDVLLLPPTMCGIVAAHVAMRESTVPVLVEVGSADVSAQMVAEYLAVQPLGVVRWQRSVRAGFVAGGSLPGTTDVMRIAALILGAASGA